MWSCGRHLPPSRHLPQYPRRDSAHTVADLECEGHRGIYLAYTQPELAADIVDKGIILIGGGALLGNIKQLGDLRRGMVPTPPATKQR